MEEKREEGGRGRKRMKEKKNEGIGSVSKKKEGYDIIEIESTKNRKQN